MVAAQTVESALMSKQRAKCNSSAKQLFFCAKVIMKVKAQMTEEAQDKNLNL